MNKADLIMILRSLILLHIILDIIFFILLLGNSGSSFTGVIG